MEQFDKMGAILSLYNVARGNNSPCKNPHEESLDLLLISITILEWLSGNQFDNGWVQHFYIRSRFVRCVVFTEVSFIRNRYYLVNFMCLSFKFEFLSFCISFKAHYNAERNLFHALYQTFFIQWFLQSKV